MTLHQIKFSKSIIFLLFALLPFLSGINLPEFTFIVRPEVLKLHWSMIMYAILLLGQSIILIKYKRAISLEFPKPLFFYFLFVILSFLSFFWSVNKTESIYYSVNFLLQGINFLILYNFSKDKENIYTLIKIIAHTCFYVSLIGLAQFLFGENFSLIHNIFYQNSLPASTFGNRNFAGQYVSMTLPLLIYLFVNSKSLQKSSIYFFEIIFALAYLYVVDADALHLAIVLLFLFYLIIFFSGKNSSFFKKNVKPILSLTLLLLFILLIPFRGDGYRYSDIMSHNSETNIERKISQKEIIEKTYYVDHRKDYLFPGSATRLSTWLNSIPMILDNLFLGVGTEQWNHNYYKYHDAITEDIMFNDIIQPGTPHNIYVAIMANNGLLGFFLFFIFFGAIIKRSLVNLLAFSEKDNDTLLAFFPAILIFLIIGMFSKPITMFVPVFLVFTFLALSWRVLDGGSYSFNLNRKLNFLSLLFLLFVLIVSLVYSYKLIASENFNVRGIYAQNIDGKEDLALSLFNKSLDLYQNSSVNSNAGITALKKKDYQTAKDYFEAALALNTNHLVSVWNLSEIYRKENNMKKHRFYLEKGLKIQPNNFKFLYAYTFYLYHMKSPATNQYYNKLKDSYVQHRYRMKYDILWNKLIKFVLSVKDYNFLRVIYQDYVRVRPTANNYSVFGVILYNTLKDKETSKKMFLKAIEINSDIEIPEEIRKDLNL